jgi:ABC-type glycerol-3-phosphate transport system substrate-binding protein
VEAAFEEGLVPHLMVSDSGTIASWYQEGLLVDLSTFIDDPSAGLPEEDLNAFYSDLYDSFMLPGGQRPGLPFTQSIQVIYYNQSWAEALGYTLPPLGWEEFQEQTCAAAGEDSKSGVVLSPQADNILSFLYAYQGSVFQAGEDTYQLSSSQMMDVAIDLRDLFQDGCGTQIANYPNPMAIEMEFERFNNREALFIMGPALMLEHVHTGANQTGRPDQWTLLPFPGPEGKKAVASRPQSGVIFDTTPEEQLASWLFLKYLVSPEIQAEWAQYSGYYPTRKDSLWFLRDYRQENPHWAEGLNLLKYSRSVPLDPSWSLVQLALEDAFEEVLALPELDLEEHLVLLERVAEELQARRE